MVALFAAFFGCQEAAAPAPGAGAAETAAGPEEAAAAAAAGIVFVNVDSLQAGYTVVADELARLEANFNEAEKNHAGRVEALGKEVQRLQNKVQQGLLAPNQVNQEQQRIARKEQEIIQQRDLALQSIQQDQLRLQQQFSERVKGILDSIQTERNYAYILNRSAGSPVLVARDEFDITGEVLRRLNGE